jgi:hypothetical protein
MCSNDEKLVSVHPFNHLGVAPFRFVGMTENAFRNPDGTTKAGGSCDHCGTGIRWECHVEDANGRRFKVGNDCIAKVGDHKLIKASHAAKLERQREARAEKREAERQAAIQAQRERNGGLTDWEVIEAQHRAEALIREAEKAARARLDVAQIMRDGRHGFRDDMARMIETGETLRPGQFKIVVEILAKETGGRKGSAKFKAELARWTEEMAPFMAD